MTSPGPSPAERRVLGFWSLLTLGINGIVGVGIFFRAGAAGSAPFRAPHRRWPSSSRACCTGAGRVDVHGRLGSAYAEDGGPYVWARVALGERFAFGVGFVAFASAVLSTAAVVSALGQYLAPRARVPIDDWSSLGVSSSRRR